MQRIVISFWLLLCAGPAWAFACPDYYRFVDLGFEDSTGTLNAGGPRVRAEGFDGTGLLRWDAMSCLDLPFTGRDGFGNTIPVVEQVAFDPAALPVEVSALYLRLEPDMATRAEDLAAPHRAQMTAPQAAVIQGEAFVCVQWDNGADVSCQFPSPYPGNLPLIVFCGSEVCAVRLLPVGDQIRLSGAWPAPKGVVENPAAMAPRLFEQILEIKDFVETLI